MSFLSQSCCCKERKHPTAFRLTTRLICTQWAIVEGVDGAWQHRRSTVLSVWRKLSFSFHCSSVRIKKKVKRKHRSRIFLLYFFIFIITRHFCQQMYNRVKHCCDNKSVRNMWINSKETTKSNKKQQKGKYYFLIYCIPNVLQEAQTKPQNLCVTVMQDMIIYKLLITFWLWRKSPQNKKKNRKVLWSAP